MAPSPAAASPSGARAPRFPPIATGARRCARIAFLAIATLVAAAADAAGTLAPWKGGATPALAARDLDGNTLRLDAFRGRTVLVNFWATWCAPCVQEMPSLQRLRDRLAAQGFEVLAVNYQENPARIRPFLDRLGLTFPVVRDHDGSLAADWGARVFPSSFIVGPDGRIALAVVGEVDWDDPGVIARVRGVIGAPLQRAAVPKAATEPTFL
jgi:peroxiredoxin